MLSVYQAECGAHNCRILPPAFDCRWGKWNVKAEFLPPWHRFGSDHYLQTPLCELQEGDQLAETVSSLALLLPLWPPSGLVSTQQPEGPLHSMGQIPSLHLQNPPVAPSSLRVKADIMPMSCKALPDLAPGLIPTSSSHTGLIVIPGKHWAWNALPPGIYNGASPGHCSTYPQSSLIVPCSSRHLSSSSMLSSFLTYYVHCLWSVARIKLPAGRGFYHFCSLIYHKCP